jgi:hypothetical protein
MTFLHDGIRMKYDALEQKYDTVETLEVRGGTPIRRVTYASVYNCDAVENK